MAGSRDRLVRRIQRRQQSRRAGIVPTDPTTPQEIAELTNRVRRLHALGVRYGQVRLSHEVTPNGVAREPVRVGGQCVTKEA